MQTAEPSPFESVVQSRNVEAVKRFLSCSGDFDVDSLIVVRDGEEYFDLSDLFLSVLEKRRPVAYSEWLNAVWIATNSSFTEILQLLLDCERFTQGTFEDGQTILHLAVKEYLAENNGPKQQAIVEILLKSGKIEVNALNAQNETILHLICSHSLSKYGLELSCFVDNLLKYRIDVNCRSKLGKTALMKACENGLNDVVYKLLNWAKKTENFLDLNAVDNCGDTAIMMAVKNKHREIATVLLEEMFLNSVRNGDTQNLRNLDAFYIGNKSSARKTEITWSPEILLEPTAVISSSVISMSSSTCLEAVRIASEKSDLDMLNLLLDCDIFAKNYLKPFPRALNVSNTLLHEAVNGFLRSRKSEDFDFICRLLKFEKMEVSARDLHSETVLHVVCSECGVTDGNTNRISDHHVRYHLAEKYDAITVRLLECNVDVNARNYEGQTALMMASKSGCASIIRTILNWVKETRSSLDLDVQDIYGQTALMKAAFSKHADAVAMLLNAGASVHLSDNRDFTVLHYALYEPISIIPWIIFDDIPRDLKTLRAMYKVANLPLENYMHRFRDPLSEKRAGRKLNDEKDAIVKKLLSRRDINVNALDCERYSPLDIAFVSLRDIRSSTIGVLRQKGARLNVLQGENQQLASNKFSIRGRNILHRIALYLRDREEVNLDNVKRIISYLEKLSTDQLQDMSSEKDCKGKTALHLAVANYTYGRYQLKHDLALNLLLAIGCDMNEADNYGRTPMHYAESSEMIEFLKSNGSNSTVTDMNGISAEHMYERTGKDKKSLPVLHESSKSIKSNRDINFDFCNSRIMSITFYDKFQWNSKINPKLIVPVLLNHCDYAFRDAISESISDSNSDSDNSKSANSVKKEVIEFITKLATQIKIQDPRFEVRVMPVGSSHEETKIDIANEFDFHFILTKFSQLLEVSESKKLPSGFVYLKQKHNLGKETRQKHFDIFFGETGILNTRKVNKYFKSILARVLRNTEFIESHREFDWEWRLRPYDYFSTKESLHLYTKLILRKTDLAIRSKRVVWKILIDIIPCIHIEGWWPDGALSDVNENIKAFGCNLIFDYPQKYYPWVPFTDPCAEISFAPAASEVIKQSSPIAKASYMIGKHLISNACMELNKYILKTCFLYCIEAFTATTRKASELGLSVEELETRFEKLDVQFWLENLMRCHLECFLLDYYPCYFMPSFKLPIRNYLMHNHVELCSQTKNVQDIINEYAAVYSLYRFVSWNDYIQLKSLEQGFEDFDRKTFLTELSKLAINFSANRLK